MDNNRNDQRDQERLSRTQYRQQQREAEQWREKKKTAIPDPLINEPRSAEFDQQATSFTREATASERREQSAAEKTAQLKKRLNIAIALIVVAIIVVYLILFYVG